MPSDAKPKSLYMIEYPKGSESFRKRNPHLFGLNGPQAAIAPALPVEIVVNKSKTESRLNKTERRFLEVLRGRGRRGR